MKIQTIKELNEKIWYRFVKVVFVIFVISLFISSSNAQYNNLKEKVVDNDSTIIYCKPSDIFFKSLDEGIVFTSINFDDSINSKIQKKCQVLDSERLSKGGGYKSPFGNKPIPSSNYSVNFGYKYIVDYGKFIGLMLITLVFFGILSTIIRAIFYYIVLGKAWPKE